MKVNLTCVSMIINVEKLFAQNFIMIERFPVMESISYKNGTVKQWFSFVGLL